ncbi:hypothetical protein FQN57_007128 [Myotisia sp. PD_48]|nr:hypothetical protein FQN57_007128 [Myotisia sp. PD_48]
MSSSNNHRKDGNRLGDEIFLSSPANSASPTVSPLSASRADPSLPANNRSGSPNVAISPFPQNDNRPNPYRMPDNSSNSRLPYPDTRPDSSNSRRPTGGESSTPNSASSPMSSTQDIPAALRPRERREPKQPQTSLAERRGAPPKQLESPIAESPDKEGLFQRPPQRENSNDAQQTGSQEHRRKQSATINPFPDFHQQYWPQVQSPKSPTGARGSFSNPSNNGSSNNNLQPPSSSINRLDSTASTSTTKAQRGSPPPPETPVVGPGRQPASDIEARYAASGIAGTATLSNMHSHNHAAQQRIQQYAGQPGRNNQAHPLQQQLQQPGTPARPWTPTEQPGSQPHGPPRVYQGDSDVTPVPTPGPTTNNFPQISLPQPHNPQQSTIDSEFQRLNLTASPPPAYSSLGPSQGFSGNENKLPIGGFGQLPTPGAAPTPVAAMQSHPAFANDPRQQLQAGTPSQQGFPNGQTAIQHAKLPDGSLPTPGLAPASPPPLPEGWIAHLDQNSGQYYYIHLPTQSTQWEFPKGPTPLNLNETPLSPNHSTFGGHGLSSPGLFKKPLASPALSAFGQPQPSPGLPMSPGYEPSVMSLNTGFTGPPPASGVELYKVVPTNGVYFGPYLRYTNIDMERGLWLGSILLVTDASQPPTIHIHKSVDLSPNPRQLNPVRIAAHQRWTFYKYNIDLQMDDAGPDKWTYAITSHLGCTRYEFLVAGQHETNWRFIATSGNDFSLNVSANERARVGGVGHMWKDIMQKHVESGGFHVQLCLGGQINADRLWKELPSLKQWLAISGREARKTAPWSAVLEEDVTHAYFHYYTSHFDQPHLREAFAQIPHISQVDDHDIFDGFGSYADHMQFSNMFKNIGRIGIEMYLLFQHHTTLEVLRHVVDDTDLFTVTGTGWHFIKYLGPAIAVVGPDCRSERNPHQVLAGPTYQGIFPKVASLPPSVQHCIWMISVPLLYPRLETAEHLAQTMATGKKAVTGAYNMLGKVTSSVAGVVGAKGAVGSGFNSVKRAVGKSGLMGSVLSPFGDIDILDELRDQWTHESKDLERTYLIRTLQGIAHQRNIRMTFLSGAVNCCGAGLVHDPSHPTDHKTMYQIISSSVVNTPPASYIVKMLHNNNKPLYVPANGQRSTPSQPTDTKEDMMEIFQTDVTGQPREHRKLMGRRNYVAIVGYDPDTVQAAYNGMPAPSSSSMNGAFSKLSLAVDFLVQGDGSYANVVKFGPVIVPSLELGR